MEDEYINPFLASMSNVLATMAMLDVDSGRPTLKLDNLARGDVSGIIGMSGENMVGSMALSFPEPVILDVAQRMLMEEFTEVNQDITDLVGELTNMVVGGAKNLLEPLGYDIGMSTPTVVAGANHQIIHQASGPKIVVPFGIPAGEFSLEISLEKKVKG